MNCTVTTDASFSKKHNIGTYAFWITSNLGRIQRSGILRDQLKNPSQAEMKAICNALYYIFKQDDLYQKCQTVYVNTDSLNAIHLFSCDKAMIRKYGLLRGKSYNKIMTKYLHIEKLYTLRGKKIVLRYIKAHDGTSTPDKYVHDWCDSAAKAQMQIKLNQIKFKNHDSNIHNENSTNDTNSKLHREPRLPASKNS